MHTKFNLRLRRVQRYQAKPLKLILRGYMGNLSIFDYQNEISPYLASGGSNCTSEGVFEHLNFMDLVSGLKIFWVKI